MTPLLAARHVAMGARLRPVSLEVGAGTLVALVGPNGSGKTSLLRALAGIDLGSGEVIIDGEDLHEASPAARRRMMSFLPASRDLVWPIRVRDVVALGLMRPDAARVDQLVSLLELETLADRPANALSTGERARVLLARALAAPPRLLLLDEPLSNLDPYWVLRILDLLRRVAREEGCALIVSLHDIERLPAFYRALLMDGGTLVADSAPSELLESAALARTFRIRKAAGGWEANPTVDRQSSP